jgi:hypothetical protein
LSLVYDYVKKSSGFDENIKLDYSIGKIFLNRLIVPLATLKVSESCFLTLKSAVFVIAYLFEEIKSLTPV